MFEALCSTADKTPSVELCRIVEQRMRKPWLSIVASSVFGLFATSCVPPSCFDLTYGTPNEKHLLTIVLFSGPLPKPRNNYSTGIAMWERFERGSAIAIYINGRMNVSTLSMWGRQCPTISQEDLIELSRAWDPVLRQMVESEANIQIMANPYTGEDDWRPSGPLLELSLTSPSGKNLQLLWDGPALSGDLDTAVTQTLEIVCANSSLAKEYLLRDLPTQVSSRLECH